MVSVRATLAGEYKRESNGVGSLFFVPVTWPRKFCGANAGEPEGGEPELQTGLMRGHPLLPLAFEDFRLAKRSLEFAQADVW